jgi:hypothetical protein
MPRTRWFAAIVVILAVVGCLFLYAYLLRNRAESLVRSAHELSNYKSGPLTSAVLKKQYGSSLKTLQDCTPSFCGYEVVVTNRVLALLRLVPYTELKSQFWLRNGVVYENMLDYMTTVHRRYNVVAHASIGFDEGGYFAVHPWGASAPLDSNGLAHISAVLSNSKKQTVLALDTGCLTRIGGCTTIAELLPSVWQRAPNDQIKCVVSNHEGWVVAPADWWWVKGAEQP